MRGMPLCRHCGQPYDEFQGWTYCPQCGGLLETPIRRDVKPKEFISAFGTYAYCLPDITCSEWRSFGQSLSRDAWELYHDDECLTMEAAFAKTALFWRGSHELESFFRKKKYGVIGTLKDGFRMRRSEEWADEYGYDNDWRKFEWVKNWWKFEWVKECDIVIKGYVKYDPKKVERDVVLPGALWDGLAKFAGSDELPIDSEIEFKTGDVIGGEWDGSGFDDRDVISGEIWVDEIVQVKIGSRDVVRQVLMSRSTIAERKRKLYAPSHDIVRV